MWKDLLEVSAINVIFTTSGSCSVAIGTWTYIATGAICLGGPSTPPDANPSSITYNSANNKVYISKLERSLNLF